MVAPEFFAQDDDGICSRPVLFGEEAAAKPQIDSEHFEIWCRDHPHRDSLRVAGARQRRLIAPEAAQDLETAILSFPVLEIGVGERHRREFCRLLVHADEAFRIAERKRPEQDSVHDAKHGGVSAYAERKRKHRHKGKSGTLRKQPDGVTEILQDFSHTYHRYTPASTVNA